MSSILSAQNLQTLRRRNIGRRWPCTLSPVFLSPRPRPRPPAPPLPPPPDRPCPNGTLHLHPVKPIVVGFFDLAGRTPLARLPDRRQSALDAAPLRVCHALRARPFDHVLFLVDADDEMADHHVHHLEAAIQLFH